MRTKELKCLRENAGEIKTSRHTDSGFNGFEIIGKRKL